MAAKRGIGDYQAVGFGGLSFLTNMNLMNSPMSLEQRLWALDGNFWSIVAKIENDTKFRKDEEIGTMIGATRILLKKGFEDYRHGFETHTLAEKMENNYRILLSEIFGKITELQGKTKMIEREMMSMEEIG